MREARLAIDENWIQSQTYTDDGMPVAIPYLQHYLTIDGLFDLIEKSLNDKSVLLLSATYDPTYGYPTKVGLTYDVCAPDAVFSICTAELQPLQD